MESTGGMGTLCERDRLRMDLMCKEADAQKLSLRTLDSSLHQLAFAYVAAFALCIPAMVASLGHLNEAREMFGVFEFIACTLVFVGAFDALMLVRSRNVCMAHIAFLEDRINEILSDVRVKFCGKSRPGTLPGRVDRGAFGVADGRILARPGAEARVRPHRPGR